MQNIKCISAEVETKSRVKDPSPYKIQHVPLACDAVNPLSSLTSEISFSDPPPPPAGRLFYVRNKVRVENKGGCQSESMQLTCKNAIYKDAISACEL